MTHKLFLDLSRALDTALACTVSNADVHRAIQAIERAGLILSNWDRSLPFTPSRMEIMVATDAMRAIDPESDETDAEHMIRVCARLGTRYLEGRRTPDAA